MKYAQNANGFAFGVLGFKGEVGFPMSGETLGSGESFASCSSVMIAMDES